ncbi:hypothetical protein [Streptomyces tibetensis]|uniref:hypothetical protein n=1 Tax=Streptomyces tibetensis TaxID=2382123 RepID=UPI0034072F4C
MGRPTEASFSTGASGVRSIAAFLDGRELDEDLVASAFAETWSLDARYPARLVGHAFVKGWASLIFGTMVLTKPKQQDIVAAQTLDCASQAVAAWPSAIGIDAFDSLARFEPACRQRR